MIKNRTKASWKILDAELGRKETIKSDIWLKESYCVVTHPLEVASRFAKHFSSVAADEVRKKFSDTLMACTVCEVKMTAPFPALR